jgi:hypothetical protein
LGAPDVTVVPAQPEHAVELLHHMREADVAEVRAGGMEPRDALYQSIIQSAQAHTLLFDGRVACMFGVVENPPCHSVWMLSATPCSKHPKAFLRASRFLVRELLRTYGCLTNVIDANHTAALRWAQWLKFELSPPEPFGPHGAPFQRFVARKE